MKLYGSHRSPYVQKVRTFIREKGVACDFIEARPAEPEVLALNPLSQVPTLARDDGEGLFDSCVIIEFIEGLKQEPRLIPLEFSERIAVKRWEALCDGIAEAGRMVSHETREPEATRKGQDFFRKHGSKVERGLAFIDAVPLEKSYLSGAQLTLADVAFGACYAYLKNALPDAKVLDAYASARARAEKLFARPAFAPLLGS